MNDSMLMQAASKRAELMREAEQGRLAARMRRPQSAARATRPQPKPGTMSRSATVNDTRKNGTRNNTAIPEKVGSKR
jgi:hypothetical protein